jgi:hypothetical protein
MDKTKLNETIIVTQDELDQYYFTLSNSGKVWKFRSDMIHSMDKQIRKEFKTRINDLEKVEGTTHYKFVAKDASPELKKYLDKFTVILQTKTPDTN